jgi:phosphoglucomutase
MLSDTHSLTVWLSRCVCVSLPPLAWLSILAYRNREPGSAKVSVQDIVQEHWRQYGRNYYSRYDYEEVDAQAAKDLMAHLVAQQANVVGKQLGNFTVAAADEFGYEDVFDKSVTRNQGIRFMFTDGSRFVFRLSGTGSSGATIRLYLEQYKSPSDDHSIATATALQDLISVALELSQITKFTGRERPSVIT